MKTRVILGGVDEVPEGGVKRFDLGGRPIAVSRVEGVFYAIDDTCTHAQASLSEGKLLPDRVIQCPRHGGRFSLATGKAVRLPAFTPVHTYPVIVEGDKLVVETP